MRLAYIFGIVGMGIWLLGFVIFTRILSLPVPLSPQKTDLIVVLTGGTDRLAEGLRMLASGAADSLFISGVNPKVRKQDLLAFQSPLFSTYSHKIHLGKQALNTAGNAKEAAEWVRAHPASSLRLITANYHMPRSLIEFQRKLPHVTIIPHPVSPISVKEKAWVTWPGTTWFLLFLEYNKYLACLVMDFIHHLTRG